MLRAISGMPLNVGLLRAASFGVPWCAPDFFAVSEESIMHYYRQRSSNRTIANGYYFDAVPTSNNKLVGNRDHLSEGDIKQVLDAYRCRLRPEKLRRL